MNDTTKTPNGIREEFNRLERQYTEVAALAGGLAHEIRNPLSTISLNLDLLFEELGTIKDPAAQRMLRKVSTIQRECEHLDEILEAFLQFARAGELTQEQCDVAELIRDFLEFYRPEAEQHRLEIRPHLSGDLPEISLDSRLMRQVLSNLVRNAQQAMPNGGLIEIQAFKRGDFVVIEIIDNGCGMSRESLEKVFNIFYSTKSGGSGLGLPTVRKIVETHGGTLHAESEIGRGTRISMSFPISKQ
ncbi:sensor histidine kinase [Planctomicrobium sp. SH668]|uniref:sensor histidine kinase n=1 Tax=Planctomicrobium sp. SH668 TaxID=3448126 RepID=UPI003F5C6C43